MLLTPGHSGHPRFHQALVGLSGDPQIENLQRSLTNLAIATNRPAINPGAVTGSLNDQTMTAFAASMGLLTEELPGWLYLALQGAMVVGATTSAAKGYVTQYAPQLVIALNTAAVKFKTTPPTATSTAMAPTGVFAQLFAPGWYKTPFGILFIAGVLFLGHRLFFANPAPVKAA